MQADQNPAPIPIPDGDKTPTNEPTAPAPKPPGRGRPRALDDAKRREISHLVAGGCGLREAARYVHCDITTIRREAKRRTPSSANSFATPKLTPS